MSQLINIFIYTMLIFSTSGVIFAQEDKIHDRSDEHYESVDEDHKAVHTDDPEYEDHDEFNAGETALHHISDQNVWHIGGDIWLPLPAILYAPDFGWTALPATSKFQLDEKGTGALAIDKYVVSHGVIHRIPADDFPAETIQVDGYGHRIITADGEEKELLTVFYNGKEYMAEPKSTLDGGLLGGGITSFYDFSITKNVLTMIMVLVILFILFRAVAQIYKKREGQAPKGVQAFIEPIFLFVEEEVAKPVIGPHKYERYMPFLMSIFFFILALNLIGQIPIFPGSANVTGNLAVTLVLALFTAVVVNFSGNRHYWQHVLWMPGLPAWIKVIITPIELLGLLLKPFTLMVRLFGNITAGHIVIISFVSLIFIFGQAGESLTGTGVGILISIPLTLFMMGIELLVAFLQAFIFCILSAVYISQAVEEAHH